MEDRFKFRFWNGKKMIYDDLPHLELYNTDDYKWLQCTGYKDKKGKLVYEGDFVKSYNDEICLIDFDDEYGCLFIKSDDNSHPMANLNFKFEVIGNIYENKELLEA